VEDDPVGVGAGHDLAAQLVDLLDGIDGDVAGTGHGAGLAVEGIAARLEHLFDEEGGTVAGGFGARQGTAPAQALAGEHAGLVAVGDALVLAEHVADLTPADADIAGRHVRVLADMAIQFRHIALAEAHDLGIALAFGIEVRPPLPPPMGMPVRAFLKICSNPRNLMMPR
jgi:hypothetical protein